jgi:hypothetical protein
MMRGKILGLLLVAALCSPLLAARASAKEVVLVCKTRPAGRNDVGQPRTVEYRLDAQKRTLDGLFSMYAERLVLESQIVIVTYTNEQRNRVQDRITIDRGTGLYEEYALIPNHGLELWYRGQCSLLQQQF